MPTNKRSKARGEEEDIDSLDAASIVSIASDGSDEASTSYYDDFAVLHNVVERVNLASEELTEKRPDIRTKALNFLIDAFRMHNLCLGDSWSYEDTFLDGIEGVIKRGRLHERVLATECLSIFALQSDGECTVACFTRFLPILDAVLRDPTSDRVQRSASATTLAVLRFMSNSSSTKDLISPKDLMRSFETIFRGSCLKGDGKVQMLDTSLVLLHIAALRAWDMLYISLPTFDVASVGKALLPCLISLLQAADVNMRIAAGETASIIYERLRTEIDENYKGPHYTDLVRLLTELATDSTKSRSKVDRKKQRHSFRDLVESVAKYSSPESSIRFGTEVLDLSSCAHHFCYDIFCSLLKGGLSKHLQMNNQVRALFNLNLPVVNSLTAMERKVSRDQRRAAMSAASKVRTQRLNTHRDRRSTVTHND